MGRAGLLASWMVLAAPPAHSGDFFIDPILLPEQDVAATLLAPPAILRAREAPIFVRVKNNGPLPAQVSAVELLARWTDGAPAGTIERSGPLPGSVAPRRSAWVRFRWKAPEGDPATDEPIVL